jgi:hypothetical protein
MAPKPDQLVTADYKLQQAEKVEDHGRRARELTEAFGLLNAYLKENPASEHREYIENRKLSHMRNHLRHLSQLTQPDQETWLFNIVLFTLSAPEVTRALEQHPELRSWYEAFREAHDDWFRKELARHSQRAGKES